MTQQRFNPWLLFLIPFAALVFGLTWIESSPPSYWAERAEQQERNEIAPGTRDKLKTVYTAMRAAERSEEIEQTYKRERVRLENKREQTSEEKAIETLEELDRFLERAQREVSAYHLGRAAEREQEFQEADREVERTQQRLEEFRRKQAAREFKRANAAAKGHIQEVNRWLKNNPGPSEPLSEELKQFLPLETQIDNAKSKRRIRELEAELKELQRDSNGAALNPYVD
ncbi:hypothetical protein [Stieleria mannarensis]|uniref:hypothetical protein n=1 Tax=Stieleria mannarensis TaxID=2755585 RepID=UPI0016014709|nr:hypothetical protein [Rhodopirellula sp. JC639]